MIILNCVDPDTTYPFFVSPEIEESISLAEAMVFVRRALAEGWALDFVSNVNPSGHRRYRARLWKREGVIARKTGCVGSTRAQALKGMVVFARATDKTLIDQIEEDLDLMQAAVESPRFSL